ncbi:bifunctional 4-hydroxy-2-oxoglutarate aldolase/2-dehydro-3-deoxy-phosphogluconate aldolase [Lyngbya confervoides]|uniref:Bifunctional 4-hydroxy-2-oxoglutarate aldolase/2-dehydro-3-deoxy-phosphogluconate aldolase n=1 Tax=Lyngbya confervoides BDU141951 TaxID=1574623 RepID=A0ABD4T5B0_9CYAN|nr:bifunctional 4-hydroxy-2-oxoglutarate aldolase/2-dehydro-3-deoxy-phosphogluconate aldolase [Lyngbya confervoides]MCM1983844.1 bifunctional 4-hydroxy-2-oxoglutarate aldolase/2-dehydro-3-deoxy-phosphogluconate aldolase [Lyngbya confervoides BDU141951]
MPVVNPDPLPWLDRLRQAQAIAVIRTSAWQQGLWMAQAVVQAGFSMVEITWNSDRPAHLVNQLRQRYPACCIGVGTILSSSDLQEAIAAGAQFIFTPHTDPALIAQARQRNLPMVPGALTPTEIIQAWRAGSSGVKVFPAQSVGGPQYIHHLQGPLGHIPLIPTGGVTQTTARRYLEAGAIAVGVAGCLFDREILASQNSARLEQHLTQFRASLP